MLEIHHPRVDESRLDGQKKHWLAANQRAQKNGSIGIRKRGEGILPPCVKCHEIITKLRCRKQDGIRGRKNEIKRDPTRTKRNGGSIDQRNQSKPDPTRIHTAAAEQEAQQRLTVE